MLMTYLCHLSQLFLTPYMSCRVVRIAEQENLHLRVSTMLFEVIKVCWHLFRYAVIIPDAGEEAVIYRRLYQHLVAWLCHSFYDG